MRTGLFHEAILKNRADFKGKTVMDVGTGTGLLAIFAAKAGAKRVIAVEAASAIADHARTLVRHNNLAHIIEVITSTVEDLDPELTGPVDVLLSDPFGTMLVNERMLESFIVARDKFLVSGGLMFPSAAHLCIAPFYDTQLYQEQATKADFFENRNFHGIDLSVLQPKARMEKLR